MRPVCLLLLTMLVPLAAAQAPPVDSTLDARGATRAGLLALGIIAQDEASATPPLADELVWSLGRPWADVQSTLAEPDSSRIDGGLGNAWWSIPAYPVDGLRAFVQNGLVESVTLDFSRDGPDIAGFAQRLYDSLGSPRADEFYATDQTGYPFSLAVDAQGNRLTTRAVPGQRMDR